MSFLPLKPTLHMRRWFRNNRSQSNSAILMSLRKLLILFLAIIGIAGCTSESGKRTPRIHHVQIKNMKFEPAQIIVEKGDSVVWTNLDIVTHDVTEEKTKAWTSAP